jgi:cation diffusion facilitator family transporter
MDRMTALKQPAEDLQRLEQRALKVSILGALVMAALGIFFALRSGSEAILLDGLFSGLSFLMALLTLAVARLVRRPDDEVFQYGYAHFAPLVNVLKSLVMVVLCSFAFLSAVGTLLDGGSPMAVGSAVVYGAASTGVGLSLLVYLRGAARRTGSVLVALDAKGALIDTLMSAAVLASFLGGWLAQGSGLERWLDYLDPTVVAVLCLAALPMPLKVLFESGREVLLLAPSREIQDRVIRRIEGALEAFPVADHRIRMLKLGNTLGVTLHLKPGDPGLIGGLDDLDRIRFAIEESLALPDLNVGIDVVFVGDMRLAR